MRTETKVELVGFQECLAKFRELETKVKNKTTRRAVRTASKIVHKEIVNRAPVRDDEILKDYPPGFLKKSIKIKAMKRKKGRVGDRIGALSSQYMSTFYLTMVALGYIAVNGTPVQPNTFMQDAFAGTKDAALNAFMSTFRTELNATAKG